MWHLVLQFGMLKGSLRRVMQTTTTSRTCASTLDDTAYNSKTQNHSHGCRPCAAPPSSIRAGDRRDAGSSTQDFKSAVMARQLLCGKPSGMCSIAVRVAEATRDCLMDGSGCLHYCPQSRTLMTLNIDSLGGPAVTWVNAMTRWRSLMLRSLLSCRSCVGQVSQNVV